MVNIGELKYKIEIWDKEQAGQDSFGSVNYSDVLIATRKARKWNVSSSESSILGGDYFQTKLEFTFRYLKDIDATMYVLHDGKKYNIIGISHWGLKRWTKIIVEYAE